MILLASTRLSARTCATLRNPALASYHARARAGPRSVQASIRAIAFEHILGWNERLAPSIRQHAFAQSRANVVVPELIDVPGAHFHFFDLLDLGVGQRQ